MVQLFKKKAATPGVEKKKSKLSIGSRSRREKAKKTNTDTPTSSPLASKNNTPLRSESPPDDIPSVLESTNDEESYNNHFNKINEEDEKIVVHLPVICRAEAKCDYDGEDMDKGTGDDEIIFLKFTEGDFVDIIQKDESGWWEGISNGEWGIFPASYVEVFEVYEIIENSSSDEEKIEEKLEEMEEEDENHHLDREMKDKQEIINDKDNIDELEYLRNYKIEKDKEIKELLAKFEQFKETQISLRQEIYDLKEENDSLKLEILTGNTSTFGSNNDNQQQINSLKQNLKNSENEIIKLKETNEQLEKIIIEKDSKIKQLEMETTTNNNNKSTTDSTSPSTSNVNESNRNQNSLRGRPNARGAPRSRGNGNTRNPLPKQNTTNCVPSVNSTNSSTVDTKIRSGTSNFSRPLGPQGRPIQRKLITNVPTPPQNNEE